MAVVRQTARIVVDDDLRQTGAGAQIEQLVDLLLILGQRETGAAVAGIEVEIVGRDIRIDRRGQATQGGGSQHPEIKFWPIVAYDQ